jgi:thioredoxin 1
MSVHVGELKDSDFDSSVVVAGKPAVVEFWAPWCGPCRAVAPVVDQAAAELAGRVEFFKVNVDDSPNIAAKFQIRSIPTLLFFKDGKVKDQIIGAVPKAMIMEKAQKLA